MDTHDLTGSNYQNERQAFYAPEQRAHVGIASHAYRWVSGDLEGSCSEVNSERLKIALPHIQNNQLNVAYPVDTIHIDSASVFPTGSSKPLQQGESQLEQIKKRLQAYENVLHVLIEGHTDNSGTSKANQVLAQQRAETVARLISTALPKTQMEVLSLGEKRPIASNADTLSKAKNRRVSVTAVVANGQPKKTAKKGNNKLVSISAISTLCHASSKTKQNIDQLLAVQEQDLQTRIQHSLTPSYSERPPLSAGDRIRLLIPQGEEISGIYEVGLSGKLEIPYIGLIAAQGLDTRVLEKTIYDRLIEEEIFLPTMLRVSTTVQEWAPVDVLVTGATFDAGRVTVNRQKAEYRSFKQGQLSGDFAKDRLLSSALYSAGGVRPDADLKNIQLIRNGVVKTVDLYGLFSGNLTTDIPLAAGDQIVVPSIGYFQSELVRRTQITPPGIRIFISNLSTPAQSNAQSAVNSTATSMPYGTRFLQALVSGNCIGGTQLTNAARRAVLISTNPFTGRTEVIERSIQQLVSDPERDEINPYLMPNDGIACYDSGVTNFRDVTRTVSEFLGPVLELKSLF